MRAQHRVLQVGAVCLLGLASLALLQGQAYPPAGPAPTDPAYAPGPPSGAYPSPPPPGYGAPAPPGYGAPGPGAGPGRGMPRDQFIERRRQAAAGRGRNPDRAAMNAARVFDEMDANHDGIVDPAERAAWRAAHPRPAAAGTMPPPH